MSDAETPLRRRMLPALLLGALAALGQAPVSVPWFTLAALAGAFMLFLGAGGVRRAAWIGWALGVGYFAAALFWIVEPFLVDIPRHGWMAPFALAFTAGGFALFWGGAFALAMWLWRGPAWPGLAARRAGAADPQGAEKQPGPWRAALFWAVALTFMELARSYVLTGFPWALLGHAWVGWAPMQLAAWVGPVGLTLLTVLAPALLVAAWPRRAAVALTLLLFAALYGAGMWQARAHLAEPLGPVVRLVQPNAAQRLKWDPAYAEGFFLRQLEFTAAAGVNGRPALVIWPETAIPNVLNRAGAMLQAVARASGGVPVALGIQRLEDGRGYNSLAVLDAEGGVADLYDKYHLVPFGEYLPLSDYLDTVGMTLFGADAGFGFSPGPGARLLDLGPLGRVLPLICYEAIFPQNLRAAPERPDWILQVTNDAWFGQISGPYQHLAQARLRAVEQGLPLVRVANTGVSAVIDARGNVLQSLPLGEAGWLDAALPPPLPPTLYARTGDAPVALLLVLAIALGAIRRRQRR